MTRHSTEEEETMTNFILGISVLTLEDFDHKGVLRNVYIDLLNVI